MRLASVVASLACAACGSTPAPAPGVPRNARDAAAEPPVLGPACDGARLRAAPADLAARGPWPVGARTVTADDVTLEVWYPARPGSERDRPTARYDLRTVMPPAEAAKIPDAANAWLPCECARELPLDDTYGAYPVVLFLHGAASFRAQSAFLATHWASRGFVVVAPDLPGVGLAAALGGGGGLPFGAVHAIAELVTRAPDGEDPLAFVRAHLAPRVAVVGHSLGSMLATAVAERPEIALQIAMAGTASAGNLGRPAVILVGEHDGIASAAGARQALADAPPGTRLAVFEDAGHLAFSDLCTVGADRGGVIAIARAHGVVVPELLATLATDGCRATDAPFAQTAPAIRAVTAGALEERLRCDASATPALAGLGARFAVELLTR